MNPINQPSLFEYEEELTETFTSSRRKSFKKRVSFAGRDEIKYALFCTHSKACEAVI